MLMPKLLYIVYLLSEWHKDKSQHKCNNMPEHNELYKLLPGMLQGITRVSISYPFDVIKVNMQKMYYTSSYKTFIDICKSDPFKFYRGSSLSYTSIGIERSLQFYMLEKLNKQYNPYVTGAALSLFSSIYNVPVQYLTTSIAATRMPKSLLKYIREQYKTRTSFYKGYVIETLKNQLGSTLFLGSYYAIRNTYGENVKYAPLYGAIAGLSVWGVIFPIDTVKTEYQTSDISIKNIIYNRYNTHGLSSFYRGFTPIIIRTVPSTACGMFVYEYARKHIIKQVV
jgi:solute carrier family 25 carnitine/acylcarnitine transporter 20/29